MNNNLGLGVMIKMLGGNANIADAFQRALQQEIESVELVDDKLVFKLANGEFSLWDDGQSCCESRYMVCDDDLSQFKNCKLLDIETKDAPNIEEDGEVHEVQFLEVQTSNGAFSVATHNEHNGYYGGFWIAAKYEAK